MNNQGTLCQSAFFENIKYNQHPVDTNDVPEVTTD